jgi:glycine hydroxymethyltransferase
LFAIAKAGDTILGMSLDAGGHLTHGAKPTISGK